MDSYIVYGIKNCDTVKKALDWLKKNNIAYEFHDYKSKGVTAHKVKSWVNQVGWEELVNKKGTTWRQLEDSYKQSIKDEMSAISLMEEKTSVIKRPIIEHEGKIITIGFDAVEYSESL
jgi:Spx/MgsR family transcriptional regulator